MAIDPYMISVGAQVLGGIFGAKAKSDEANKAIEIGNLNAESLLELGKKNSSEMVRISGLNADAVTKVADLNSKSVINTAFHNSMAHVESTMMNLSLDQMDNIELINRHIWQEQQLQGAVRAEYGASNVRVGTGTPLEVLVDTADRARSERVFMINRARAVSEMKARQGTQRAQLTMMEGQTAAQTMLAQAAIQSSVIREEGLSRSTMYVNDLQRQADAMRRNTQAYALTAKNQGMASLISGITGGINTWVANS